MDCHACAYWLAMTQCYLARRNAGNVVLAKAKKICGNVLTKADLSSILSKL